MQRVILTTGGTGGHIFPALAVAQELRARFPNIRLLFVGGRRGPEERLALQAGLEFAALPVAGVLGRGVKGVLGAAQLSLAVTRSLLLVGRFKPDVVVGFGGYAGFAPVAAAWLWGRPTALQEQNSVPGAANRILGKCVKKVCLAFEDVQGFFPAGKCIVTGNPVRKEIAAVAGRPLPQAKNLLVLGGSQGARALNRAVAGAARFLTDNGVNIRHQAGKTLLQETREMYSAQGVDPSQVTAFIDDMAEAYAWADLVYCRAGATTVAELAACGRPAVFTPFPYATHDHQTANAKRLGQTGAAILVPEPDLGRVNVGGLLLGVLSDSEKLQSMASASAQLGKPQAAAAVADVIETVARKSHGGVRAALQAAL